MLFRSDTAGHYVSVGEALQAAKMQAWNLGEDHINAFKFTLLGDPAMHLAVPSYELSVTSINKKIFTSKDTLQAGNKYTLTGSVQLKGQIKNDFNGRVDFVLYDAMNYKKTLANASTSIAVSVPTQENILFQGKATVTNGIFNIDFLLFQLFTLLKIDIKHIHHNIGHMLHVTHLFTKSCSDGIHNCDCNKDAI